MEMSLVRDDDPQGERLHRRLRRNTWLVVAAMVLGALTSGDRHVILGVVLGAALGELNHRWVSSSLGALLGASATDGTIARRKVALFALRLGVIAGAIALALGSGRFHLLALLAGFSAFVGAVFLEAGYQIMRVIRGKDSLS
jgi:hypothetical protein